MHASHLLLAGLLIAGAGALSTSSWSRTTAAAGPADVGPLAATAPAATEGHYVLVVEGDRNALAITHCAHKTDPWAGVPQGLASDWSLTIHDATGAALVKVPLDVARFSTGADEVGKPARAEGCIVRDARIAMLVNVPALPGAARYTFARGDVLLGQVDADHVLRLAEGGR